MMCTLFQMSVCLFFYLERKTRKDVYIYDCYNFNWYILLNVKHKMMTESPNSTHAHKFTNMRCWGRYLFHVGLFIT